MGYFRKILGLEVGRKIAADFIMRVAKADVRVEEEFIVEVYTPAANQLSNVPFVNRVYIKAKFFSGACPKCLVNFVVIVDVRWS